MICRTFNNCSQMHSIAFIKKALHFWSQFSGLTGLEPSTPCDRCSSQPNWTTKPSSLLVVANIQPILFHIKSVFSKFFKKISMKSTKVLFFQPSKWEFFKNLSNINWTYLILFCAQVKDGFFEVFWYPFRIPLDIFCKRLIISTRFPTSINSLCVVKIEI
jgi:hypothetical protein